MTITADRPNLTLAGPLDLGGETLVIGLPWPRYLDYMRDRWPPGRHLFMCGPTGEGKTTHADGLLSTRRWVMAFDPKGEDETLSASGFIRVSTVPTDFRNPLARMQDWQSARQWDEIQNRIAEGLPVRVIVGGPARTEAQDAANQDLMRRAFAYLREAGGWTAYVDEFELISSPQMFGQAPTVNRMLITARRDRTSVVTSYQAQAWVSRHASRQALFGVIWPTGDRKMIEELARALGRNPKLLAAAVDELPPYHVLVVPRGKNGGPFICTSAPRVN